jgi:hypothetical protein
MHAGAIVGPVVAEHMIMAYASGSLNDSHMVGMMMSASLTAGCMQQGSHKLLAWPAGAELSHQQP